MTTTVVAAILDVLDRHDGVGALGHDAAGRDRHRLAGPSARGRRAAGGDPRDDRQRPRHVGRAQREAVHRRARKRRQVDGRDAPARRARVRPPPRERDVLGLERPRALEHERERLVDRQQLVATATSGGFVAAAAAFGAGGRAWSGRSSATSASASACGASSASWSSSSVGGGASVGMYDVAVVAACERTVDRARGFGVEERRAPACLASATAMYECQIGTGKVAPATA